MARRYKQNDNFIDEAAGLISLLVFLFGYTKYNEIREANPELLPYIYFGGTALLIVFVFFIIRTFVKRLRIKKVFTMSDIDNMGGVKFEYYLADILRKLGYKDVRVTEKYDLGIDIIAIKDGVTWGIQAKRYNSMVKASAVRAAYTALSHYGCERAIVVTNNYYSNPAKTLAASTSTILIDRDELARWVYEVNQQR